MVRKIKDYVTFAQELPTALLKCPVCNKPFINTIDEITGKMSIYLWVPDCKCMNKDFKVCMG